MSGNYGKMLIGIGDSKLKCFADQGDYLFLANSEDKMRGRLPKEHHFFVSLTEEKRLPSRYGVVKRIEVPISAIDLAILDFKSMGKEIDIEQIDLEPYENFLKKINTFPEHTPIGATWLEKGILKKSKELRVHKVFFTNLTKEEKNEIFEF